MSDIKLVTKDFVDEAGSLKQDKLTAGENITITEDNEISMPQDFVKVLERNGGSIYMEGPIKLKANGLAGDMNIGANHIRFSTANFNLTHEPLPDSGGNRRLTFEVGTMFISGPHDSNISITQDIELKAHSIIILEVGDTSLVLDAAKLQKLKQLLES